ncbi:alpha/beta hydrolase [Desertibacillus haloalkaliphilus]|uniref:alpha/beta hydrolase n=1 Tax=Desertibacillus haloalkaliphilus TaxID=1328930 RepID=UPI001C26E577|nr:alpha/beta fold hydrolase [Desertibacillus haloalkaliphilus]MBU8906692.1 alpha/beta fold hydrolase [Desertibacillus haloalkaliphilus]
MIGCLCLHGFTGEPWEVEPVADYFQKQKQNWLVYTPTLPGHGPDGNLKDVTYKQWVYAAEVAAEELLKRCSTVYVIGFSMGGMLASYIAAKYPIDKLVLLSAAAYYMNPQQLLQDLKQAVRLRLQGKLQDDVLYQRYSKKVADTPMTAVFQFMQAVKRIRPYLKKVTVPTLIIQGEQDGIIPKKSADYLYTTISSKKKRLVFLRKSKHMVCHDFEKDQLIEEIEQFLESTFS